MIQRLLTLSLSIVLIHVCSKINAQQIPLCESLIASDTDQNEAEFAEVKIRRVRAICDAIYSSQTKVEENDLNSIPEFDMKQIESDQDAEQILRRFRRRGGRGGGSSGGGRSGGGGRFSSGGSRFSFGSRSSSGGSRFFGSRSSSSSSSSSSGGSRIFSRSSSSSSSGSGSSRIFSRSSSSSAGGSSAGTGSSRIFSRSSGSSSSSGTGSSRIFSRSSSGSAGTPADRSSVRIFSRNPSSSHTGNRVREAIRTMIHKPSSSSGSGVVPGTGGTKVISGPKPSLSDQIRKITHSGGGGGSTFGGSGGSGSSAWVRAGKKFLPHAVRFGKRYYERRKYSKGMYAGAGAGAGYYAGSRMNQYGHHYHHNYYNYPPVVDQVPDKINGQPPTVFYCIQEDLNTTLVNETLNDEGFGTCNISGKLVTCPIEIECRMSEADNCCEDELGTPYCCGGAIPIEYASEYGSGYGDDAEDAAETIHQMLNMFTAICALLASICFTMWHRRGH